MEGHDILIHLAANPSQSAEWDSVVGPNIEGTYNAYEAAVRNDLDRVVFASTNHVVNMHAVDDPDDPDVDTRFATAMFLSLRDCQQAIVAATIVDLSESPITANVVSRNDERFLSLTSSSATSRGTIPASCSRRPIPKLVCGVSTGSKPVCPRRTDLVQ